MVAPIPDDGTSIDFPPYLIEAVTRHAEFKAELTAACIEEIRAEFELHGRPFSRGGFPAGFLAELGAFAQVRFWERHGLHRCLPDLLPTAAEVAADIVRRVLQDPTQFDSPASATISQRLFRVWLNSFAWDGMLILQADAVVGTVDDDRLVEALAQLLWAKRHAFTGK